ncbi:high-affinity choline transporter 1-like [Phyllopteryx taeniolatus]|uniref:high-affinity choline transporter 1-like n=1 Tax=Phyllopteryx taeniolatus TaxID=161469 RepID=UPI002AD2367D|nr:high-affinity choline transporter 1-like [Phyllopteryx taeniolatus]XP_061630156.1 high-affinity choline transporter 1-like [Phyllopteryx taeniolatus]XP_061630157.1 high-affinity choline transporter 1-like [Phyllopteryx taeniolatus]XP_061630158.1 high-affinity choline transporter 1-like [Phyllopteryx taeniolatus]
MAVHVTGLVAVVVFYLVILLTGIFASRKSKQLEKKCTGKKSEVAIIGGRNINVVIGVFTMTATWVGGAYIMGTAEAVYSPDQGLLWGFGPLAFFLNFFIAGLFFAKPMRSKCYVTMLDPFQHRYGQLFTTAILLPALVSDILWVACILAALGGMMSIVLEISSTISIPISAGVSIIYTLLGGLYAVAYTDIIQLSFIFVCLWLCIPFMFLSPAVTDLSQTAYFNQSSIHSWVGEVKLEDAGKWMDNFFVMAIGGLAYQALFQRILAASSSTQAQVTCFAAGGFVFIMGIPSIIIGAVAASADWNQTEYGLPPPHERGEAGNILPLVLSYITPNWMSVLGIGAIAAAVMSSMDSALLSSGSMFTQNLYKATLRKQASERELQWVIRITVLLVGLAGTGLAFNRSSIIALWVLATDLLYCIIAPQLVCVVHLRSANCYGAISGYVIGLLLRGLSGEPALGITPVLLYPGWREEDGVITQYFPFRTLIVLISLATIIAMSWLFQLGFTHHLIPQSWDVLDAFKKKMEAEEEEERPISNKENNFVFSTAL